MYDLSYFIIYNTSIVLSVEKGKSFVSVNLTIIHFAYHLQTNRKLMEK